MSRPLLDKNFFFVAGWMRNDLNLRGVDLMIYAIIFGFSQEGEWCRCSLRYFEQFTGTSRSTVMRSLSSLQEKGHIVLKEIYENGVKFNHYKHLEGGGCQNDTGGVKMKPGGYQNETGGGVKMKPGGGVKMKPHIYTLDNKEDNKEEKGQKDFFSVESETGQDISPGAGRSNVAASIQVKFRNLVLKHFPEYVNTTEDENYHIHEVISYHRKYILENQKRQGNPYPQANNEAVIESLDLLLGKLPQFWKDQFSLGMLAKQQARIISSIKTEKKTTSEIWEERYKDVP